MPALGISVRKRAGLRGQGSVEYTGRPGGKRSPWHGLRLAPFNFAREFDGRFRRNVRGQGSVEYLFVVVFLVGFIVSVMVPTLQQAELTYAIAAARAGAAAATSDFPDLRLLTLNHTVRPGAVSFDLRVYNRSSLSVQPAPQALVDAALLGIHRLAPTYSLNATCAETSNYAYCIAP